MKQCSFKMDDLFYFYICFLLREPTLASHQYAHDDVMWPRTP